MIKTKRQIKICFSKHYVRKDLHPKMDLHSIIIFIDEDGANSILIWEGA
jgi:hypothetical protein